MRLNPTREFVILLVVVAMVGTAIWLWSGTNTSAEGRRPPADEAGQDTDNLAETQRAESPTQQPTYQPIFG